MIISFHKENELGLNLISGRHYHPIFLLIGKKYQYNSARHRLVLIHEHLCSYRLILVEKKKVVDDLSKQMCNKSFFYAK